ncbi:MAG TPA: hypothetical protein VMX55_12960 [candidate division Zixibacteria bacterium]|nr:hypothetical protein [candidate division Zixibacteria bacterium]
MLEINKTEDWGFFFFFIGGNLIIFNAIIGFIIKFVEGSSMYFLDGFGLFDFVPAGSSTNWPFILGGILNILVGIIALLAGLKIFTQVFYNIMTKIDVAITGLILMFLGLGSFTTGGLLLVIGGIYCFIFRLTVEGANNRKGK